MNGNRPVLGYDNASLPWWRRGVIYQIYPRSFQDSDNDGIGDLTGIINRLDYLNNGTPESLGVDAIWLSPVFPSPMADFGYDVSDYCDIDPLFGDLATFDRLVKEAHKRDIKVIIDWVPNHSSEQHPWFRESRSGRDNPKRGWYVWRDAKPDGLPPNNWGSFFGGPAWTRDQRTGQYYLHQFAKEQPELNWRNPQVVEAMLETLRFWLRRGVDGFRMDVIGLIIKDADLRDNPPNPDAPADLPQNDLFNRQHHIYNADQDEAHPVMRRIRRVLDEFSTTEAPCCAVGELWGDLNRWVRYYGERGDELHLPFNFRLLVTPWNAGAIRSSVDDLEAALPRFAWPNYVLGNHDQPRLASRLGSQENARLAAMLLLTLRGTPTLYYGDELGMENGVIPPDRIVDPQGKNLGPGRTRDIARTPMQWDAGPNAGFSSVSSPAGLWLPVSDDYVLRNVSTQSDDPHSMLTLYRKLLRLRRLSPALFGGSYKPLRVQDNCYLYTRAGGGERVLIALNFSAGRNLVRIRDMISGTGNILLSTYLDREGTQPLSAGLELRPYEGAVVEPEDC